MNLDCEENSAFVVYSVKEKASLKIFSPSLSTRYTYFQDNICLNRG